MVASTYIDSTRPSQQHVDDVGIKTNPPNARQGSLAAFNGSIPPVRSLAPHAVDDFSFSPVEDVGFEPKPPGRGLAASSKGVPQARSPASQPAHVRHAPTSGFGASEYPVKLADAAPRVAGAARVVATASTPITTAYLSPEAQWGAMLNAAIVATGLQLNQDTLDKVNAEKLNAGKAKERQGNFNKTADKTETSSDWELGTGIGVAVLTGASAVSAIPDQGGADTGAKVGDQLGSAAAGAGAPAADATNAATPPSADAAKAGAPSGNAAKAKALMPAGAAGLGAYQDRLKQQNQAEGYRSQATDTRLLGDTDDAKAKQAQADGGRQDLWRLLEALAQLKIDHDKNQAAMKGAATGTMTA